MRNRSLKQGCLGLTANLKKSAANIGLRTETVYEADLVRVMLPYKQKPNTAGRLLLKYGGYIHRKLIVSAWKI